MIRVRRCALVVAIAAGCGGASGGAYVPPAPASATYQARATAPSAQGARADPALAPLYGAVVESARGAGRDLTADSSLAAVADDVLGYQDAFGRLPDSDGLEFLMRHRGLTEPLPLVFTAQGPSATVQADLRTAARSAFVGQAFNRVGIARRGDRAALLLDGTFVDLEPFARRVQPGTRAVLGGTLAAPYASPRIVVTDPAGEPHELSTSTGRAFHVPVPLERVGRYQIEIIGDSDRGTTVLANFPVYCGIEPPQTAPPPGAGVAGPAGSRPRDAAVVERELLEMTNLEREHRGLPALIPLPALAQVARAHSQDMAQHAFVGHASPRTGQPVDRVKRAGIRSGLVLENVARAYSAHEVHGELMRSPGHRANILNRDVTHVGIGVVLAPEGDNIAVVVTEKFVRLEAAIDPASARDELLRRINERRAALGAAPLHLDPSLSERAARGAERFFAERRSQEDVVDDINGELQPFGIVYRRSAVLFSVVSNIDQAAGLEPLLDRGMRAVGIGVSQGDRPDMGTRTICVIFVLTWPR